MFELSLPHHIAALPGWLAILLTAGVPVLLALGLGYLMHQLFTPQEFAANVQVGAVKYGFVVEIYAVVAALALVGAWDIYQTARDTMQKETSSLYMLALSVDAFDGPAFEPARQAMRSAIRGYAGAVVGEDWPAMQAGQPTTGSEVAFQRLARVFLDLDGSTGGQLSLQQKINDWVSEVGEARIARLSVMSRTLSGLIWALVLTVSVATIAFQWFFGGGHATMHYAMGLVIALIVGAVLLVALKLAFPFVGDPALLTPRPFLALMEVT
ncbi:bestrophin-like domain [Falsiroseomonas selenitidurans]|uniref:DUF4239 domain-containing protein n=1 Tax=Falsiroseomonas selenitidurans TaxID=2716335 RepID=A0ABX1E531_9PROT|nr:DUF4239 domain-containing protein [Falsiroseomonas selenitidurans]NKC32289.1 DUF4239 domain-containing protein [Falsiroseomonas selenitidurans]